MGDFEGVAEGHGFVGRAGGEETLAHGGLPDDEAEPLLGDEDVGFLDGGEGEVGGVGEVELLLESGVG